MSTLASIDEPTATMATEKSAAPIWRRASIWRASAWTVCVMRSDHFCTSAAFSSMASTSRPSRSNCPAAPAPNRPSPMTRTGALWGIFSTNDGPFFRVTEQLSALGCSEGGGQRHCTNATCPHGGGNDVFSGIGSIFGHARGESARGERRNDVEENPIERFVGDDKQRDRGNGDNRRTPQDHRDGEADDVGR